MPDPGGVDGEVEVDNDCRRQAMTVGDKIGAGRVARAVLILKP
jgi:hypothetical protein